MYMMSHVILSFEWRTSNTCLPIFVELGFFEHLKVLILLESAVNFYQKHS